MLGKLKTLSLEALKMLQQDKREQLNSRNPAVQAAAKGMLDALAAELVRRETSSGKDGLGRPSAAGFKVCKKCGVEKAETNENFGKAGGGLYWQPDCRACMAARSKEHRENDLERQREINAERREKEGRPTWTPKEKAALKRVLWSRTNGICRCCAEPIKPALIDACQIDHILPVSKGGRHTEQNYALAHARCNTDKHKKSLEAHWAWRVLTGRDAVRITQTSLDDAIAKAGQKR